MVLLNLCSKVDESFNKELTDTDLLTDYAVEFRYPGEWYEPSVKEAKDAYKSAEKVRQFVKNKLTFK